MTKKCVLTAFCTIALLSGCSSDSASSSHEQAAVHVQMSENTLRAEDVPRVSERDARTFGEALNEFAFETIEELDKKDSFVLSPFSLHAALSMTAYGAAGKTYEEMADALQIDRDRKEASELIGAMNIQLRYDGQQTGSLFKIANRVWMDQSVSMTPDFLDHLTTDYLAPVQIVDFFNYPNDARLLINQWVENVTEEMIQNILPPDSITRDTRFALVNAVYFDGEWQSKFKKEATKKNAEFKVSKSETTKVDMMHQTAHFPYYKGDGYQAVTLDYKNQTFAMMILLPDDIDGLSNMMHNLDENEIRQILDQSTKTNNVVLSLPKFRVESELDAVDVLKAMGMKKAFEIDADFSNMTSHKPLFIQHIIHKAVIDVDEAGTKAAAATVIIANDSAAPMPEDTVIFTADHPFAFVLFHKSSGAALFTGQFVR